MKKVFVLLFLCLFLVSCSLQAEVTPEIFVERLSKFDKNMMFDEFVSFSHENLHTYFFSYSDSVFPVLEIRTDERGNAEKISISCTQTDKLDLFLKCVEVIVSVYSPDETASQIIDALYSEKNENEEFSYYETQWYLYSAVISENGLFFSTENKKLSPQSEVELSLKANDIVEY